MQDKLKIISEKIAEADMVLVGIGEKFADEGSGGLLKDAYEELAALLNGKNYFVITTSTDDLIYESGLREDRIVRPLAREETERDNMDEPALGRPSRWDTYMKWLQGTLRRKLLVLELGVGLKYPQVIRFPFEKMVYFHQRAELVRVHDKLFQLPAELNGRGLSVSENAAALLRSGKI